MPGRTGYTAFSGSTLSGSAPCSLLRYLLFMATRHTLPVLLLAAALLASGAAAQTPVRPAQFVIQPNVPSQFLNAVAMDGAGNVTFLWTSIGSSISVFTRRFSAADTPQGPAV